MINSDLAGISWSQCNITNVNFTEFRLIVITSGTGPYSLAFPESQSTAGIYVDYLFNFMFLLDIIQNFFSAYQTQDLTIVDEAKVIY